MIIAISGFAGSGKTTLGTLLANRLNYKLIAPTFKDLAKAEGISLMEFQKKAEKDPTIDLKFDEYVKKEAEKNNCVISTWLGAWMVDADLRIWLYAPLEIRAQRVSERDSIPLEEARKSIVEREKSNRDRYLKLYNIDIFNTEIFDLCINSASFTPEEMADIVKAVLETRW